MSAPAPNKPLDLLGDQRLMRPVFWLYAALLFVGTHWPKLEIPIPGRPDLLVHLSIFSLWTVLLMLSGLCGVRGSWRAVALAQLFGILYAAVDEGLQAIPMIHRTAAWDDYAFDMGGVVLGTLVNIVLRGIFDRRSGGGR